MLTIKHREGTFNFEGINGELDGRGFTNATEFYNKHESYIVMFKDIGDEPSDAYHTMFMNALLEEVKQEVKQGVTEIEIDLDKILADTGGLGDKYTIEVKQQKSLYLAPKFITHFKLFTIVDFLLIPIHTTRIEGGVTEVLYGDKVMLKIAPVNRRFPGFVSERILSGEIEKLSEKTILGYKYLEIESVLRYDIALDYINYKG